MLREVFLAYSLLLLPYFLVLNLFYLFLLVNAASVLYFQMRRHQTAMRQTGAGVMMPTIAVIVPAHNEGPTILESVRALLEIEYPDVELIVVNDGSSDDTLSNLTKTFRLFPAERAAAGRLPSKNIREVFLSAAHKNLIVIDKENGGKADSLNAGINYCRSRLFCAVDADSLMERDGLSKLVEAYMERQTKMVALGGIVRIANDCRIEQGRVVEACLPGQFLPAVQALEYIRAFLCGRAGWTNMNSLLILSGAFGVFEKKAVIEVGGYRTDMIGEDMELTVRLHRRFRETEKDYNIYFMPDPVCWTQVPDNLKTLGSQRMRWQQGLMGTMRSHLRMVGNPRYGLVGLVGMPYFFLFELLGPVVEVTGYIVVVVSWAMGWLNYQYLALFFLLAFVFSVILSLFALLLEEYTVKRYNRPRDVLRLFWLAVVENFGYRQLNSWWRMKATALYFFKPHTWGDMKRREF